MMFFVFEGHLNSSAWIWVVFVCFIVLFTKLFYNWKRSNTLSNANKKHTRELSLASSTSTNAVCTSLSCVRCSASVFSTENLLEKWRGIENALSPDQDVSRRMKKGLLRNQDFATENPIQAPTVFYLEELPSKPWYTTEDFPKEVPFIERDTSFEIFLSEFLEIYKDLDVGWVSNQVSSGGWYLFYLINQGVRIEENYKRCPKTMALLEKLPLLMSDCAFGNIMFSVLLPSTIIDLHSGPTNVRIRCHVPLKVPQGYFISVAGEERAWQENKVLIFDDSFYHKVYHHGYAAQPRVVLMVDFWHPCLTFQEKEIIKSLFSLKP